MIILKLNGYDSSLDEDHEAIQEILDTNAYLSLVSYYVWDNHWGLLFDKTTKPSELKEWWDEVCSVFSDNGAGFMLYGYRADDPEWLEEFGR